MYTLIYTLDNINSLVSSHHFCRVLFLSFLFVSLVRFVVELCQVRSLAGAPSQEMVLAFGKLREGYQASLDRDSHLEDVSRVIASSTASSRAESGCVTPDSRPLAALFFVSCRFVELFLCFIVPCCLLFLLDSEEGV